MPVLSPCFEILERYTCQYVDGELWPFNIKRVAYASLPSTHVVLSAYLCQLAGVTYLTRTYLRL